MLFPASGEDILTQVISLTSYTAPLHSSKAAQTFLNHKITKVSHKETANKTSSLHTTC